MSYWKELFKKCFLSFIRTVAVGIGVIVVVFLFLVTLKKPPQSYHTTNAIVMPTHNWTVKDLSRTTPTIVRINIEGIIGMDSLKEKNIRNQLVDTIHGEISQDQVRAVMLFINTPGGVADDCAAIYQLLKEYKARTKVPVYAFVDGLCASGGMYLACTADKVYCTKASLVGSVGTISGPFFNFVDALDKIGVKSKTILAGKDKDSLNPFRQWREDEGAGMQHIADSCYAQFLDVVTSNRSKLTKEFLTEQGAKIYTADESVEYGFTDGEITSLESMLELISKEVGIESNYQVVAMETPTWFNELFNGPNELFKGTLFTGKVEHTIKLGPYSPELIGKRLFLYCPELSEK